MATLISTGRRDHMSRELTSIGSSEACHIQDRRLLPTHAYIKLEGSGFWVLQARSDSTVYVNDRAIRKHPL